MRFLCDQMLNRLGRWLRAAGYDTEIIEKPCLDSIILNKAIAENRLLITRDRHFLEFEHASHHVIHLKSNLLSDCIKELSTKVNINWLHSPFSRCLICNHLLSDTVPQQYLSQVPPSVAERNPPLRLCPSCNKVYWEGSHTKRMLRSLQSFTTL